MGKVLDYEVTSDRSMLSHFVLLKEQKRKPLCLKAVIYISDAVIYGKTSSFCKLKQNTLAAV